MMKTVLSVIAGLLAGLLALMFTGLFALGAHFSGIVVSGNSSKRGGQKGARIASKNYEE